MRITLMDDLPCAARNLWRNRGFAGSAILILAIGIAASTGLFAVLDALVLHPLPYADADRLARVRLVPSSGPPRPATVTADEFRAVRHAATLDGAYLRESFTSTLAGTSFPESVFTELYSGNAPTMLGLQAAAGRVFTEADAPPGADPARVAMLTYGFWQRRFAGQRTAIGHTLQLDGEPFTVIGVLPREYTTDLTDIVMPLRLRPDERGTLYVRLRADVAMTAAQAELQQLYQQFAASRPEAYPQGFRVQVSRIVDEARGAAHVPTLTLLFAASALLLLIGCANVTILLLARGRTRVSEMAVRHALGANRTRLVTLLLGETLLMALVAGVLGVLVVRYGLPLVLAQAPGVVAQRAGRIIVGPTAMLFATALSSLVSIVAGVWPALTVSRARGDAMRNASAARAAGTGAGRVGSGILVAAQVALAVVLLAGTGAAIRALVDLYRAPAGYDPTRVTIAQVHLPVGRYTTWPQRVAIYERLRAEVASESAVEKSTISLIPTGPPPRTGGPGRLELSGGDVDVLAHSIASDYFSTLNMPLTRGRMWSAIDDRRAAAVTVINETMARRLWPGENPIGKRVRNRALVEGRPQWILNAPGSDGWFEVIGVLRDVPNMGLREPVAPAMYYPYTVALGDIAVLLVRTKGSPIAAERDLRTAVGRADGTLPIIRFITPETFMNRQQEQFVTTVLLSFAGVALLLASFGLFSVACYSIAHRTREFGIRIALGAAPALVLRAAMQSTIVAVMAGLGIGLVLSLALGSVLARWSIRSLDDPLVLVAVVGTLLISTLAAALIPARRAMTIQPTVALRAE
jgi:predicted permease